MKVAFHNLGCKVNYYETEAMKQALILAGYEITEGDEGADIYIVNTCSVTNIADRKSRQMLHKYKKSNPEAIVIAAGCYVQAAGEELLKDEAVDIIVGNDKKNELPAIIEEYLQKHSNVFLYDLKAPKEYEEMKLYEEKSHTRAYIKVQDGCNQFCSYCIIPFARGRIRSRGIKEVVSEAQRLVSSGICEVVLTGIHISSYGLDKLKAEGDYGGQTFAVNYLAELIEAVAGVEGIKRVRISSLEPRIITEEFAQRLKGIKEICPHFHLSLQSGCDSVLKRMNRHYTTEDYKKGLDILRRTFDLPALTTDVITGFPGETEEEFADTVSYLKDINLYQLHVFKFSRRKGTVADRMKEQLTERVKAERSDVLLELTKEQDLAYRKSLEGRVCEVLFEESMSIDGRIYMTGYTREYVRVALPADNIEEAERLKGTLMDIVLGPEVTDAINLARALPV